MQCSTCLSAQSKGQNYKIAAVSGREIDAFIGISQGDRLDIVRYAAYPEFYRAQQKRRETRKSGKSNVGREEVARLGLSGGKVTC